MSYRTERIIKKDRLGAYKSNFVFMGAWALAGLLMTVLNGQSITLLYLAVLFSGIGIPMGSVGITMWASDLSQADEYAKVVSVSQTFFALGGLLFGPIPGIIADSTGSYKLAFLTFAICVIVAFILIQWLYIKHLKNVDDNV